MSQYWENTVYEQPSEEKIRKNAADTVQKEKKKGKRGVRIWSVMRIMRAGLTGVKDMSEPGRWLTCRYRRGRLTQEYRGAGRRLIK